jgi:nitrogen fixation NifU-like protein
MFDDLNDLYQQVILDHSRSPRNFRVLPDANRHAQGHNPICGDNITLYLKLDGDRVVEATFQGSGCAISKASSSILTETLKGKSRAEVRALFEKVRTMVTTGKTPEGDLGKLAVFTGVHKFPARVKCAILPWHAAISAIDESDETVSTE